MGTLVPIISTFVIASHLSDGVAISQMAWQSLTAVIYEKTFQVKVPLKLYCFSEAERQLGTRSFRKTNTHILLTVVPYYGFVPVIYPRFLRTLTFGNSPLIIARAHHG